MPNPIDDVRSSVVRAMVPEMIGLKSPAPVANTAELVAKVDGWWDRSSHDGSPLKRLRNTPEVG